jgi:hypothetical protein
MPARDMNARTFAFEVVHKQGTKLVYGGGNSIMHCRYTSGITAAISVALTMIVFSYVLQNDL